MKREHLYYLAGAFVLLLIIALITQPRHASVNVDELVQTIIFGVAKDDVRGIEIYKESSKDKPIRIELKKVDDVWHLVTKYNCKAQEGTINRLLDNLLEMTGKVRSSDPKHLETYKITDEQGIHVILKDEGGKPLANLIFGKRSGDYNTGFVRFSDKNKVYFVDKNILTNLGIYGDIDTLTVLKDNSFVDLQAVKRDKSKLELIALVKNGKQMVVKKVEREVEVQKDSTKTTKKEDAWVLVKGKKEIDLDKNAVTRFLNDVTSIRASKVVDRVGNSLADYNKNVKYGFLRARNAVVFKEKGSAAQQNVVFGKEYEKGKGYYMNVQYDGLVYEVSKGTFDRVLKWVEDLPKKVKKS
ncbi:MAG: DUF4340 domain-containing protein [Calditrichaeota bacterium]|nr:DUF4340 domain-containing protein [Calditrichota bacterium]